MSYFFSTLNRREGQISWSCLANGKRGKTKNKKRREQFSKTKNSTEFLGNSLQLGLGARDKNDVHLLGSQLEGKLLANTIGSTSDDYERFIKIKNMVVQS